MRQSKESSHELWNTIERNYLHITEVLDGEEREKEQKAYLKK